MISRNFFKCVSFSQYSVEITEICSHQKIFPSNQLSDSYLVNALLSRNFCQKIVTVNFRNVHVLTVWKNEKFSSKTIALTKLLQKERISTIFTLCFIVLLRTILCFSKRCDLTESIRQNHGNFSRKNN